MLNYNSYYFRKKTLHQTGSFYRYPASLQNGAFLATGYESVRIRIGTTIPDPSFRIIILLISLIYTYLVPLLHLSRGKVPCTLNPHHGLTLRPVCLADFARRNQVVPRLFAASCQPPSWRLVGVVTAPVPPLFPALVAAMLLLRSLPVPFVLLQFQALVHCRCHFHRSPLVGLLPRPLLFRLLWVAPPPK